MKGGASKRLGFKSAAVLAALCLVAVSLLGAWLMAEHEIRCHRFGRSADNGCAFCLQIDICLNLFKGLAPSAPVSTALAAAALLLSRATARLTPRPTLSGLKIRLNS